MTGLLTLVPSPNPSASAETDPFVGRIAELNTIDATLSRATAGAGGLISITGADGVGKTRLCAEAADRAVAHGLRVVRGRCWPGEGAPALWPWPAMLERLSGVAGWSGSLLPDDPSAFRYLGAVVDLLASAAARSCVLLVVDDLHHAPPEAQLLTDLVAGEVQSLGVVLLVSERTGPGGRHRSPEQSAASLHLEGLAAPEAARLLHRYGWEIDEAGLSRILRLTGGRPGCLRAVAASDPADLTGALVSLVRRRMAPLDDEVRRVLAFAAVLGAGAGIDRLGSLAGLSAGATAEAVDRTGGLLRQTGGRLCFADDVVADAVLDSLPTAVVLDAHAAAATLTSPGADGGGGSVDRLVRHATHAVAAAPRSDDDTRLAVTASRAAARALSAQGRVDDAAELLHTAVALADGRGSGLLDAGLLVERAEAELATGRLAAARRHFGIALDAADADGDTVAFAAAAVGLGGVWVNEHRGSVESRRVVALQRRALRDLPPDEKVLRCRLQMRLAAEADYAGHPATDVGAALAEARRLAEPRVLAEALSLYHHTLLGPEHATQRLALAGEQIDVASTCGDRPLLVIGLCWRTVDLFLAGDRRAEASLRDLHAHLEAVPLRSVAYVAAALEVMLLIRQGRLDEAERAAERCFALGSEVGDADAVTWFGAHLCAIRWLQGRSDEVLPLVEEMLSSPSLAPNDVVYLAVFASLAAESGERDRARSALDHFDDDGLASIPRSSTWHTTMLSLAEAAAALGDADLAARVDEALTPFAHLPVMPSLAVVCLGSTHRPLGLLARTLGRYDRAVAHLEAAVTANRALRNRPLEVVATADLAETLALRSGPGDVGRAVELFGRAAAEGRALGLTRRAERYAGRADELIEQEERAGQRRGSLSRRGDHWVVALDGREAVVAHRVGLDHLARLVAEPGRELTALALAGGDEAAAHAQAAGGLQPVLDDRAVADYRRRLQELEEEADDAHLCHDLERASKAELELDAVLSELEHASGLGGRVRTFTTGAERARTSVRKAITRAIAQIAEVHPPAARVLTDAVTTGSTCRYDGPVVWDVS